MVPGAGIEPARCRHRGILSPLRLPVSPPGRRAGIVLAAPGNKKETRRLEENGGRARSRTEVHGFAVRCIATLPPGRGAGYEKGTDATLSLPCRSGAGNETRTRDPNLGKVVLYQLSYSRVSGAHILAPESPLSSGVSAARPRLRRSAAARRRAGRSPSTTGSAPRRCTTGSHPPPGSGSRPAAAGRAAAAAPSSAPWS